MSSEEFWRAVVLGVVQGITEFLPISSSGHLTVAQALWRDLSPGSGLGEAAEMTLALHVGTLASILVIFWKDLLGLLRDRRWRLCALVALGSVPAAAAGLLLKPQLESLFEDPRVAGFGFVATAAMLWAAQRGESDKIPLEEIGARHAWWIGLWQAMALLPGVSRSGSTIAAGLLLGLKRQDCARYSFLLAIPVTAGACLLEAVKIFRGGSTHDMRELALGAAVSFVVGLAALRGLLAMIVRRQLHWFVGYCLAAGTITLIWSFLLRAP